MRKLRSNFKLIAILCLVGLLMGRFNLQRAVSQDFRDLQGQSSAESSEPAAVTMADLLAGDSVLSKLGLDNDQRARIKKLLADYKSQTAAVQKSYDKRLEAIDSIGDRLRKGAEFRREISNKTEALRTQVEKSLLGVLNSQQQTAMQAMLPTPTTAATKSAATASKSSSSTGRSPASRSVSLPSGTSVKRPDNMVASFAVGSGADRAAAASGQVSSPSAAPRAGSTAPKTPARKAETKLLSFNFQGVPWTDVLTLFAKSAGLTLNPRDVPPGAFTYFDRKQYTPTEALDVMNRFLLQIGYILVRHDRFLTVFNVKNGVPPNLVETVSIEELSRRGKTELLRVIVPLGDREGKKAAEEVRVLLGPQGTVASLESAGSIVVTDIASNLLRVVQLLKPPPKPGEKQLTFRAFPLKNIRAEEAADIVRSLFGLTVGVQNVSDGRSGSSSSSSSRRSFDIRAYYRSRYGRSSSSSSSRGSSGSSASDNTQTSKAKVTVDVRTNSVLITATATEIKLVEEIVKSIDVKPDGALAFGASRRSNEPYLEVYQLKTADAREVAKTLSVLHKGMVINEDGRAKRLHVWATADKQREIAMHISQLDGAAANESLAVIPLQGLNAYNVSATLTSLYKSTAANGPTIQLDASGRSLIVKGSSSQILQIRTLVTQLAAQGPSEPGPRRTVTVVGVDSGSSAFVRQTIGALYPQITISTTAALNTRSSGRSSGSSRGSRSRTSRSSSRSEDAERSDRIRRFLEMRQLYLQGSSPTSGSSRGSSGRSTGRSSRGTRSRGR